ncbi:MAG TPA: S53 family peptidase [Streptosporangiaceae bacterium]
MPHVNRHLRAAMLAAAGSVLVAGVVTGTATAQPGSRVPIAGTHPAWATKSAHVSALATGNVTANVYLAGQDQSGLAAYATAVSTPGNALYRHYLSAAQVAARYGPTQAQISAVESWLTGSGLRVTKVAASIGGYVQVQGSLQQASQAFGVTFGMFRGPDKRSDRAPQQAASVPAAIASDVSSVIGLDTATHNMKPADTLPPPGPNYWVAPPCSQYYGQILALKDPSAYGKRQPYNNCGYTPRQIRGAYHVGQSGMSGKGQTVAIVDAYASPTMLSDANQYAKVTGDQPFRPGQYTQDLASTFTLTAPNECDAAGWYGEETLDVESVHGQAPDANVTYVGAASCTDQDLLAALALIVDNHLASIVSNSWGEPFDTSTLTSTFDQVFQAGAAEGIGFFFSSGDNGYESPDEDPGSDTIQTTFPDSSPFVTSVGGTSLAIGPATNYEFETSWGTMIDKLSSDGASWSETPPGSYPADYDGSGGGGVSTFYNQPSYQAGVVPNSLALSLPNGATATQPMRVVPDVAALADPSTGFLIGQTDLQPDGKTLAFSLSRIGGTSLACPTFAGIEADAQQAAGHPLGFANPAIYQRYGTSAYNDVTDHPRGPGYLAEVRNNYTDPFTKTGPIVTFLRTLGINGEGAAALPAVKGYDDATGVGSPDLYIQSFQNH